VLAGYSTPWEIAVSHLRSFPLRTSPFLVTAFFLLLLPAGCGDSSGVGKTVPVTGQVTLDDRPLSAKSTVILFKPDTGRGNTSPFDPTGTVDAQGRYTLFTNGKKGAPPGWYKVIVTATELRAAGDSKGPRQHHPTPRSLLPARYGQAATSPLAIEVAEDPKPRAYDLELKSK
jgi:hypothetical protein